MSVDGVEQNSFKSLKNNNDSKMYCDIVKEDKEIILTKRVGTDYSYKHEIVWKNAFGFLFLHLMALWGLGIVLSGGVTFKSILWIFACIEGVCAGAHRLYAHRAYKAKPLLKAILLVGHTLAGQNSMFIWCRDHRLHHRYSDTDGDPHNSKRGFFFSHIGWLMCKKHPYVIKLGRRIDMSDLEQDWMVMFQKKYYYYLYFLIAVFIPVAIPCYYFGETFKNSLLVCYFLRYIGVLHGTWLVNSAAHIFGTRPYDKKLQPVESWFVSMITMGEGWHNYHHAFPWDYKAAELSILFNQTASIIRFFERIGLAYDLKTVSPEMVSRRVIKTGDGTHYVLGNNEDKMATTAFGLKHPLNPTYNVVYQAPDAVLKNEGLPLYNENDVFNPNVAKRKVAAA